MGSGSSLPKEKYPKEEMQLNDLKAERSTASDRLDCSCKSPVDRVKDVKGLESKQFKTYIVSHSGSVPVTRPM